jgi:hypothetical protein
MKEKDRSAIFDLSYAWKPKELLNNADTVYKYIRIARNCEKPEVLLGKRGRSRHPGTPRSV